MKPDAKLVQVGLHTRARVPRAQRGDDTHTPPPNSQASILRLAIPDVGDDGPLPPGPLLTVNSAEFTEVDVSRTEVESPAAHAAPRLHLPHASVSEAHAKLVWRDGAWCVVDVGSSNGTFVNYVPLEEGGKF